jgi:hypothetical protein
MRIQSEDGSHFIQVIQQEVSLPYYPSTCVQIEASAYGFSATRKVWFRADDMHIFLTELMQLEQQRSGTASLGSISPNEASLSLETVDRVGHMIAKLDLNPSTYLFSPNTLQVVNQHFPLSLT